MLAGDTVGEGVPASNPKQRIVIRKVSPGLMAGAILLVVVLVAVGPALDFVTKNSIPAPSGVLTALSVVNEMAQSLSTLSGILALFTLGLQMVILQEVRQEEKLVYVGREELEETKLALHNAKIALEEAGRSWALRNQEAERGFQTRYTQVVAERDNLLAEFDKAKQGYSELSGRFGALEAKAQALVQAEQNRRQALVTSISEIMQRLPGLADELEQLKSDVDRQMNS